MTAHPIQVPCRDGHVLGGHLWSPADGTRHGTVIVNPATGVAAKYYHRYARFLADQGFTVITYDYRGIGASRPARLRGYRVEWRHWGELDFDAVIEWVRQHDAHGLLAVVGHSIGGFLPGFAPAGHRVDRILTVGAQYAYWRNYARRHRLRLLLRWHVAMPALTLGLGYFPGKRLGWLEDLPAGVALEWSFRRNRMELNYPAAERPAILARFSAVRAPILAIGLADDEYGTPRAIRRGLDYYTGSRRQQVELLPTDLGFDAVGHFSMFHDRHGDRFWPATVAWLRDGVNPWADRLIAV